MHRTQLRLVVGMVMLGGCATGGALGSRSPLTGVRLSIGTAEIPAPARGAFGLFDGVVEFAAGRGRLDVTARRDSPPLFVQGVPIAAPLAGPGDYYLFDNTGFVLVRPASQTFSTFALSESSYRLGDVHEPREGMMEFSRFRADTLAAGDSARLTQHGPFTVRWHLDRRDGGGSARVLVRGWIELADAPAGEASVVRWFGAAAALAGMGDAIEALPRDSLQVTAAVVLPRFGFGAPPAAVEHVNLIAIHPLIRVTVAAIDPARLVLPSGFTETPWPGFWHAPGSAVSPRDATDRWRTIPTAARK